MTSTHDDQLDLLTAYALDALEPEEIVRVSALLEQQPELRVTLAELRATLGLLPLALEEAEPPPDLRRRTLDFAVGRTPAAHPASAPIRERLRRWTYALGGLAGALLVALVVMVNQLSGTQAELVRVQAELALAQDTQRQVAQIIQQPGALVTLAGAGGQGAIVRRDDGALVLAANLPALQAGRVYQLWLIEGQNAPASGGIFTVDQQGLALVTLPSGSQALAADTFAVTDEPDPGSSGPTTPILISGSATSIS